MDNQGSQRYASPFACPHRFSRRSFLRQAALTTGYAAMPYLLDPFLDFAGDGQSSGAAHARIDGENIRLGNALISADWELNDRGIRAGRITNMRTKATIPGPRSAFRLVLTEGAEVLSDDMKLLRAPLVEELKGSPGASRFSDRVPRKQIVAQFVDRNGRVKVRWRAILSDQAHYLRQEIEVQAVELDFPVREIELLNLDLPGAQMAGRVKGSPVTAGDWFFAFEHPLSSSEGGEGRLRCSLERQLPLRAGHTASYSSVVGTSTRGQLRRAFLAYVEAERAHPYRTFLHYNSWYDLGYFTPYDEAGALEVIGAFGKELHERRGVSLDSFLFDDGWDDHESLWRFNTGFPRGFTAVKEAAQRFGAAPGVWMSPWGGYGKPRQERLDYGKRQGFETNETGFALSGPVYFRRFKEVCEEMIRTYGVNQFKFDGTGNAASVTPGSEFGSDFEAAIALINDLRAIKPDLYVNLTTGTYPSPFWLWYADSTWRGGEDHDFAGVGSNRQQWITYRDAATFKNVVQRGPLYPLNALMLHGLIYAKHAKKLDTDPHDDFGSEIKAYFGSGTQLQEMYISHDLLTQKNWDDLAEAAIWSRKNATVLVDTHWVGGHPGALEVYGWASWADRKGILTLRNPSDKPQRFGLDIQAAFELPAGAPQRYEARSPWKKDRGHAPMQLRSGTPVTFRLGPFEILTLEATAL